MPGMKRVTDIDRAFAGCDLSNREVAAALGVTPQCIHSWRSGRNQINPTNAKILNARFGLPLHVLRPDVWDPPQPRRRKAA